MTVCLRLAQPRSWANDRPASQTGPSIYDRYPPGAVAPEAGDWVLILGAAGSAGETPQRDTVSFEGGFNRPGRLGTAKR